ncbi:hypothetical protein PMZ90_23935, partial [Escherichia coli]|nr:hypothetical protein [Escherichia coli]MDB6999569.1 hypothetical protein [Escherichia coli]
TSGEKRVFLVILFTSFSGSLVSRISGAVHSRSAISFALWGTIMHRGDDGFTQKISDLASAVQSQR